MKNKHSTKSKINKMPIIVIILLIVVFTIYNVISRKQNKEEDNYVKILDNIEVTPTETENKRMLQVKKLQEVNPDIVGWLEIEGTEISYPVLQDDDNEFYMTHNYKKEYTKDGSLFLDKDYNWELPSTNLLIYGHNNNNGKMFNKLLDYKDEKFYKEHQTIRFTTEKEDAVYEIIAVFESRVYYKSEKDVFRYYYFINAENEQEFNEYVNNSKEASLYETGKTAAYGDQLITLSTCAYHTEDGRFAIVARMSRWIWFERTIFIVFY